MSIGAGGRPAIPRCTNLPSGALYGRNAQKSIGNQA